MASAIGFIAAPIEIIRRTGLGSLGLSDGIGHRLHCGRHTITHPNSYAGSSPMASAIGFIAAVAVSTASV